MSLSILPTATLRTITLLLAPQLPQHLLLSLTSDSHPSDIIGTRLSFILIYPIPTTSTNPRAPPKYEAKNLRTVTIGEPEDHISSQMLSECGFVTGDLLYVAITREGETLPPLPAFAHERPPYSAPPRGDRRRGGQGLDQEQWARGGGFAGGRGGGRDRDRRGSRSLREAGWTRGEEVPAGGGVREDWVHGSRGRGGGLGWTREGRRGGDRW